MKNEVELLEQIRKKNFKSPWHLLDYLILAGYSIIDSYSLMLKEYPESTIYNNVAFSRYTSNNHSIDYLTGLNTTPRSNVLIIGIIDDNNVHLSGLYDVYRKFIFESSPNGGHLPDIESTCEIIRINGITPFILEHLRYVTKKYYGYEFYQMNHPIHPNTPSSNQQMVLNAEKYSRDDILRLAHLRGPNDL